MYVVYDLWKAIYFKFTLRYFLVWVLPTELCLKVNLVLDFNIFIILSIVHWLLKRRDTKCHLDNVFGIEVLYISIQ